MKFDCALLTCIAFASPALNGGTTATPPNGVKIKSITYGGTGCPQGSLSSAFTADRTAFTLIFDKFYAETGTNRISTSRKNCQINLEIDYPQGWSWAISRVDFRGYVSLPKGMKAIQKANYYTSGETDDQSFSTNFTGPVSKDYRTSDLSTQETLVWSACGKTTLSNINTSVQISGDLTKPALITVDSVDKKVKQVYGLKWKKC